MRENQYWEAVAIGEANKQAMQLLANHCLHARPELVNGTSEPGSRLDLPIGLAQVRCEHAEQPKVMSMHLTEMAVQFYESNCVGCEHRSPNGLMPTIASVAADRRRQADEAKARQVAAHTAAVHAWTERRSARRLAVASEGYPVRDIADDLDALDLHPDHGETSTEARDAARRRLVETARRAPQVFTGQLVQAIMAFASDQLDGTACTVLRMLARSQIVDPARAADVATRILAARPVVEAGQIVAELLAVVDPALNIKMSEARAAARRVSASKPVFRATHANSSRPDSGMRPASPRAASNDRWASEVEARVT